MRARFSRILLYTITMIFSWLWFSTNPSPETCINDGLGGACSLSSELVQSSSTVLLPQSLRRSSSTGPNQTKPNQTRSHDLHQWSRWTSVVLTGVDMGVFPLTKARRSPMMPAKEVQCRSHH